MAAPCRKAAAANAATAATGHEVTLMAKKAAPLREWRISIVGAKSKYIGRVEAPDAEAAVAKAAKEFKIEPARRFRLIAEPVE